MEDDLHLGLYVIKVLCLVVIAMSLYKITYTTDSYMTNADMGAASLRTHGTERSDFMGSGGVEQPVFWNLGSVQDTNALLQKAASQKETEEGFRSRDLRKLDQPMYT